MGIPTHRAPTWLTYTIITAMFAIVVLSGAIGFITWAWVMAHAVGL